MKTLNEAPVLPFRPEAMLGDAQHRLAGVSRAWTQLAHGMMTAQLGHLEAMRALCAPNPGDLAQPALGTPGRVAAHQRLEAAWAHYEAAVKAWRDANDELARCVFSATESMIDTMPEDAPPADAAPAAAPARPERVLAG